MKTRTWYSPFAILALVLGTTFAMVAHDVEAKRLGGGKSFGRQSDNVNRQANPQTPPQAAPQQSQAAPAGPAQAQPQRNRWMGPLAGLAAGLGIAALLSHFGLMGPMAEMLGSFLLIALLVMAGLFVWRMLKRGAPQAQGMRREPVYEGGPRPAREQSSVQPFTASAATGGTSNSVMAAFENAPAWGVPADFDAEGFARSAKVHFIRLQTAWDAGDLADIREFTTPEMYAEVKMQLAERKGAANQTEVVDLEAEVLGVERSAREELASVRFKGTLRDGADAQAEPFTEVWNLIKPTSGRAGWMLAGIQQVQ